MSDDTPDALSADRAGVVTGAERPATFRDVFAVREYRALYLALVVDWVGEYLARAAITVLVYPADPVGGAVGGLVRHQLTCPGSSAARCWRRWPSGIRTAR